MSKKSKERKKKERVFKQTNYTCSVCKVSAKIPLEYGYSGFFISKKNYLTIDHIVPRSKGGTLHEVNLFILCMKCNNEKANHDPMKWLALQTIPIQSLLREKFLKALRFHKRWIENKDNEYFEPNQVLKTIWKIRYLEYNM